MCKCFLSILVCFLWSPSAMAWWDEGHMRVAAMAYELLTPEAKAGGQPLDKTQSEIP